MTVEEYAKKILADHNCDEYTYGGTPGETVLSDLKEAYPDGMEFPYVDVANAIIAMSKVKPIERKPWVMCFDTDSFCDGIGFDSFGAAEAVAEDTLAEWMCQQRMEWKDPFHPTEEELDEYNYMICTSSVEVRKYNPKTDEYDEFWSPSYEVEEQIGWKELTREDIAKEKAAVDELRKAKFAARKES